MTNEFINFIKQFKTRENAHLIEAITSGYKVLTESVSPIVFHNTTLNGLVKILRSNQFNLTNMLGNPSDTKSKNKFFYLSLSRIKHGGYAQFMDDVVLVLDGDKLNQTNSGTSVDYWGDMKPKSTSERGKEEFLRYNENEDRLLSNRPVIKDASKYIQEIHINISKYKTDIPDYVKDAILLCEKLGINCYIYDNKEAWKLQDKRKSINIDTSDHTISEEIAHKKLTPDRIKSSIDFLVDCYNDYKAPYELYQIDYASGLMANISNFKSDPDVNTSLLKLISLMKKEKVNTLSEFIEIIKNRSIEKEQSHEKESTRMEEFINKVDEFIGSQDKELIDEIEYGDGILLIYDLDTAKYNDAIFYMEEGNKVTTYRFDIAKDPINDLSWVDWEDIMSFTGLTKDQIKELAESDDKRSMAQIYLDVANYYGWENIDSYPMTFRRLEFLMRHPGTYDAKDLIEEYGEKAVAETMKNMK